MAYENITTFSNMVIVPEKFTTYVNEETTKKSALVQSGVAVGNEKVAQLISGTPAGGNMIQMPFYKELDGEDEVFGEETMDPTGITTARERATLLIRQKAWGATDLSRVKGGDDPMAAIMDYISGWWLNREQVIFLNILSAIFNSGGALEDHILDVSAEASDNTITVDTTLDAKQLMGDAYDKLGVVVMHSATYTSLQKQQKIETEYSSDLKIKIDYYLGYRVIVDDDMPVNSGVYDTYFLGAGAFTRESGTPDGLVGTETDRDSLSSLDILINRKAFILHPNGISFEATELSKAYATNDDLALASNWARVKELKNIPIVCLRHMI